MKEWERLLYSVADEDKQFGTVLKHSLDELGVSASDFCDRTDLSESTIYKIVSGHRRNIQLDNFRRILTALKRIEQGVISDRSIAVITKRESLEEIRNTIEIDDQEMIIKGYPATTVEEALKQSIIAERDGVDAIICGPITAYTIEDILYTPVIGLDVGSKQIRSAVKTAVKKI
jgi:predicted transcriptional regulator